MSLYIYIWKIVVGNILVFTYTSKLDVILKKIYLTPLNEALNFPLVLPKF